MSDILSLTADPRHPGTLYAGTDTAVYKTVDGGRSWRPFNTGALPARRRPACLSEYGCRKTVLRQQAVGMPGTTSWNRNNGWVLDVAVDPVHSNVVYSASGAVRKSTDGGHTWKDRLRTDTIGAATSVTRIAIAPTRPESIYAIAHDHATARTAIYKSTNAGRTWQPTGGSLRHSLHLLRGQPGRTRSRSRRSADTLRSRRRHRLPTTDGGATWQPSTKGLPANGVTSLAADPRRAGTVYASVADLTTLEDRRPATSRKRVPSTRRPMADRPGTRSSPAPASRRSPLTPHSPQRSTRQAGQAATHPPGTFSLLRSTDSGRTWTTAPAVPSRPTETTCLIAWNSPFNGANHDRIAGSGTVVAIITPPRGSSARSMGRQCPSLAKTVAKACLRLLADSGRHQLVTGIWSDSSVTHWSFGRPTKTHDAPTAPNVKVLADGRVTKIPLR